MRYQQVQVDGLSVFYRAVGNQSKPVLLLLHGFPSASHYFRELMPLLAEDFYCIAPDMIGFGQSESPDRFEFTYSFESESQVIQRFLEVLGVDSYYLYVFDYGAPVGFRLALNHPEQIRGIISQNGNVYEEGLGAKWQDRIAYWANPTSEARATFSNAYAAATIKNQYLGGEKAGAISPDGYSLDIYYSQKIADYGEKQNDLILDYRTNVALYPKFQQYLRDYQPAVLAIWGKNDDSFIWAGAEAFKKDVPDATVVPIDAGHFALESHSTTIAEQIIHQFMKQ